MGLSAGIVSRVAFGRSFRGLGTGKGDELVDIVHEALAMLGSFSASDFFPYFGWIVDRFSGLHKRLEKNFHELDRFYQRIIDDHLRDEKGERDEGDIVDLLLNMEKNETQPEACAEGVDEAAPSERPPYPQRNHAPLQALRLRHPCGDPDSSQRVGDRA